MLTSGGDCQGLNSALRGVAKTLYNELGNQATIYGIRDGYRGLIEGDYHKMEPGGLLRHPHPGRHHPGHLPPALQGDDQGQGGQRGDQAGEDAPTVKQARVRLPGDPGGQRHPQDRQPPQPARRQRGHPAQDHRQRPVGHGDDLRLPVRHGHRHVSVIDSIHSTAFSHSRVFIVEVMGHKAGWLTLYAGIASGADVIVIPGDPLLRGEDRPGHRTPPGERQALLHPGRGRGGRQPARRPG